MNKSEDNLIEWIRRHRPPDDSQLSIGIGDDMAMFRADSRDLLVGCDMLMDGVDFDSAVHKPEQIGRKALAVNLSDCAAMAVRPRWALVSVALPNEWTMDQAQRLLSGVDEIARRFDVTLIGGDTNSWDRPLVIDVTIFAEPWPGIAPVRRDGAKPGDVVIVNGPLGGSRSGHHMTFEPRVNEARLLADMLGEGLHAMMDLSDGLSTDGGRMAEASGCGIELEEQSLDAAAAEAAREQAATDGRTIVDHVLNDGEDFELLLAVDTGAWERLGRRCNAPKTSAPLHEVLRRCRAVGVVVPENGLRLLQRDGSRTPIESAGWRHFTDSHGG